MARRGTAAGRAQRGAAARRNRNARPAQGQNLDVAQIAQTGRDQAAQNINFLGQQLGGLTDNFAGQQQRQIDAQQARLDNPFLAQAQGIVRNELGRTYGSPELEAQMRAVGASAMDYRPDQIVAPTDVRNVNAVNAAAAQMGPVRNVQGVMAQRGADVASRDIAAAQMGGVQNVNAVNAQRVFNIRAGQVGAGGLGSTLMAQAMNRAANAGQLSPEASRDAVQAARQGMAARGMATGNAGLAAELLNRDRYSRARASEDLAFAQGVQQQDIGRQFQNVANRLTAAQANQSLAGQMSLADQAAAMDAQRLNQAAGLSVGQTNAQLAQQASLSNQDAALRASLANQQAANQLSLADQAAMMDAQRLNQAADITTGQTNAQFAQQANLANQQAAMDAQRLNQARDVSLGQMSLDAQARNQAANMEATGMNRAFLGQAAQQALNNDFARSQNQVALGSQLLGYDPYRQAIEPGLSIGQPAMGAAGNFIGNNLTGMTDLAGNVGSFNTNRQDSLYNSWMNNQTALRVGQMQADAMNNAARMQANAYGGLAGAQRQAGTMGMIGGIGQGVLGAASLFALSDKREKTEIKPLGKSGSVLGLKIYSYKYKGDDKERIGMMAQEVKKVLPEAVAEVNYKGKKRLAIKPAVIGAALAEELAAQAA